MRTYPIVTGFALLLVAGIGHTQATDSHPLPLDGSQPRSLTADAVQVDALKTTASNKAVGTYSAGGSGHPMEGRKAPPINLKDLNGKQLQTGQIKADVIVLDFWATWCPPCRKGLPLLQQFQNWAKQNKKSVAVLTVNLRETPQKVRKYWKEQKFNMPVLMDRQGDTAKAYGVQGIPQTVIIHQGQIVRVHVGYSPNMANMLKAEVEELLAKSND